MMEFSEEEIRDVFKLLSAVLQMGNIEFMTAGGAQITSKGGRRKSVALGGSVNYKNLVHNDQVPRKKSRTLFFLCKTTKKATKQKAV